MQPPVQPGSPARGGVTIAGRHFGVPWIIGGVVLLLVLVCSCCGVTGALGALGNTGGTQTQATATQGVSSPAAPKATSTPSATATPKPTPKPLTPEESATRLISQALGDSKGLSVKWDAGAKILTVEHDASDNLTNDLIKVGIKVDTFKIMQAIYTKWSLHPSSVIVHENGPTTDKYGNNSKGAWGTAALFSDTAAKFNWGNLDYAQAWDAYDVAYFISGL